MSYTIKMLEQRLGMKLLNRTTRSIAPTQEGEQLLRDIEPLITEIQQGNLIVLLEDWEISYSGYYMYYPSRRESSPLFRLLVDALRLSS